MEKVSKLFNLGDCILNYTVSSLFFISSQELFQFVTAEKDQFLLLLYMSPSSKWNAQQYHALILAGKYNMILPAHLGSTLNSREVERLLSAYGFRVR
jgi:hypothetical protein